tara:strand:+ start:68 stop:202 length:135 start_codon:yes stop_codon:yes gene_type:complete
MNVEKLNLVKSVSGAVEAFSSTGSVKGNTAKLGVKGYSEITVKN